MGMMGLMEVIVMTFTSYAMVDCDQQLSVITNTLCNVNQSMYYLLSFSVIVVCVRFLLISIYKIFNLNR